MAAGEERNEQGTVPHTGEPIQQGTIRINDAGEQEMYVLGAWAPRELAERYFAREEYFRRLRPGRPEKRAKVVSKSALGPAGELSREQQAWADRARARIRRAGHRRSAPREVLIELFAREDCAVTVHEVDKQLKAWLEQGAVSRAVGIASVYRGVEVLQDLRLIARVDVGDGVARYERARLEHDDHHHHHFVCDRCGVLVPFDDDALESAISGLESRFGFQTKEHEVVLRGTCAACR